MEIENWRLSEIRHRIMALVLAMKQVCDKIDEAIAEADKKEVIDEHLDNN